MEQKDKETLRRLAHTYMTYATLPVQEEKRKLWQALNRRQMQKPMVLIDQLPWNELADESLTCTVSDPFWRYVEGTLRKQIYQWEHLPVDMVLPPYILLPRPIEDDGFGLQVQKETRSAEPDSVQAQHFTDILCDEADLAQIRPTTVTWDKAEEERRRVLGEEIFGGIAPIKLQGRVMHLGIWDWIAEARGVTNCYLDLLDRPEFMHAIMERFTACVLDAIDQYNAIEGFDTTSTLCHCSHTFSDDLPVNGEQERGTADQAWSFGLAQLFSSVSPEITAEFEVPYMQRIFARFGAVYYGCCDRLDDRLDIVDRMPNIRKISCSPWSDREAFAANLPKKYVMSNKPSPALLATESLDEQAVREDLRRTMRAAKAHDVPLEMILKDVSTVKHDPARLWRWAAIAAEETAAF